MDALHFLDFFLAAYLHNRAGMFKVLLASTSDCSSLRAGMCVGIANCWRRPLVQPPLAAAIAAGNIPDLLPPLATAANYSQWSLCPRPPYPCIHCKCVSFFLSCWMFYWCRSCEWILIYLFELFHCITYVRFSWVVLLKFTKIAVTFFLNFLGLSLKIHYWWASSSAAAAGWQSWPYVQMAALRQEGRDGGCLPGAAAINDSLPLL
jgi:hypothetical protein